jgi:hypothetical protein
MFKLEEPGVFAPRMRCTVIFRGRIRREGKTGNRKFSTVKNMDKRVMRNPASISLF